MRLRDSVRWFHPRLLWALLLAFGLAGAAATAQELPPPDVKAKPKPRPKPPEKPAEKGGGGAAASQPQAAPPVLLLSAEFSCSLSVDGESTGGVRAKELRRVNVTPGQHLLACVSDGGKMRWQKTIDAKAGQQVVEIKMSEVTLASGEDFDKAMARVWLGMSDLKVAGDYVSSVVVRSWGFHDPGLSTALHTAHEYLKQQIEDLKRLAPSDPARKKMAEDCVRISGIADKYVDLMTKAITEAQKANSWMGSPNDMFSQARALVPSIAFPPDALAALKQSGPFREELPVEKRPELGLPGDSRDFHLGVSSYQGSPNVLAVVVKGGLADKMGLKSGDRLVSVNGQNVASVWELKLAMRANAGKTVRVLFEREGKQQDKEMRVPSPLP